MEFHWPIGTEEERKQFDRMPGFWIDATPYGTRYFNKTTGKWAVHPGKDFNLNKDEIGRPRFDLDAHSPVYAAENGVVRAAGRYGVWGNIIVIEHVFEHGRTLWTRYAHVEMMQVGVGDLVERGRIIARVGNAFGAYPYHLHYDIANVDLGARPADWPGDNRPRVLRDYIDPVELMRSQMGADGGVKTRLRVTASPAVNVRAAPGTAAKRVGRIRYGEVVDPVEIRDGWARIETTIDGAPVAGWIVLTWTQPAA